MNTATKQQLENYLDIYPDFEKSAAGNALPWLKNLRQSAFARFCEVGFPTIRAEDWRFTNVSPIAQTQFLIAPAHRALPSPEDIEGFRVPGAAAQFGFVDGRFAAELSQVGRLPAGVHAGNLSSEIAKNPGALEQHLGRYLNTERDPFAALNTAFLNEGAYVHVRKATVFEEPICFLYVSSGDETPIMTHPRNLIVVEEGAEVTVVEDYVSLRPGKAFCNTVTELIAGDNATVSHYMIEREDTQAYNVSTLRIEQGRNANVSSHSVLSGGGIVRNNVHPVLNGEGGECLINGLFIGGGKQHLDNYMLVEHAKAHCASRQFYNGVLDKHARGVFHGRIIVHKDAQKTDAKQTNRNLLLSDEAQIDTKPQLEIYADDVKCTHGATIGQIEENALFYLRSRGIDEVSARRLLLMAFASECLERMKPGAARTHVEEIIHQSLERTAAAVIPVEKGRAAARPRTWEERG